MQRVTSRQRLFSWDQFDATAENTEDSSSSTSESLPKASPDVDDDASEVDYMTCYSISQTNSKDLSRSISMLSMANFSAHAYDDEEDSDDEFEPSMISARPSTTDLGASIPTLVDDALANTYASSGKKRCVDGSYAGMNKSVSFSNLVLVHSGFNDQKHDPAVALQNPQAFVSAIVSNEDESSSSDISFLNLGEDIHIQCLAFLSLKDLQNLESTCKYHQSFLASLPVRNCVWWNMINLMFPHLSLNETVPSTIDPLNKEQVNLSPACVKFVNHDCSSSSDENAKNISIVTTNYCHNNIHYGSLLSKSLPAPPPTSINRHYFNNKTTDGHDENENPQTPSEIQEPFGFASSNESQEYCSYDLAIEGNTKKVSVVQYTGEIAIGDRSIRSNHPFPRPHRLHTPTRFSAMKGGDALKLFNRLRSCNRHGHAESAVLSEGHSSPLRSFVSPFISKIDAGSGKGEKISVEIDLTPRMMAYFEVSILSRDESQEPRVDGRSFAAVPQHLRSQFNQGRNRLNTDITNPCVAIGLSTHGYSDKSRMPGWDSFSYGYHGDDGGIFHSRGSMIRVYGPKYNEGDTIGCGVNYQNGGIFFTLNGNFLGYAWMNEKIIIEGKVDLFPTIGVDTNNPLACNFGDRQFAFDFSDFVKTNGSKYGTV